MSTQLQGDSNSLLRNFIAETIAQAPPGPEFAHGSKEEGQLAEEVKRLADDQKNLQEVVDVLFPDGVPPDLGFYARLIKLHERLGWNEVAHEAVGLLWAEAIRTLAPASGEKLLALFTAVGSPDFFMLLDSLRVVFQRVALGPEFAVRWLPEIVKRIGNDLAAGAFWKSLATYCDGQVDSALKALEQLRKPESESALPVAAYILGALRALPLDGHRQTTLIRLEADFRDASASYGRSVYFRSWIQTAWRGKMSFEQLKGLAAHAGAAASEEQEEAFLVFTRFPLIPSLEPELLTFTLNWLEHNASPNISPVAKHHIVELAATLAATGRQDAAELIVLVQPIPPENKGTWAQVERYLVSLLKKDQNSFISFCAKLANRNARGWLKVMQSPRSFEWLLQEMRGAAVGVLVINLAFSHDAGCRKLGLYLFDELDLESLPVSLLTETGEREIRLGFCEAQRTLIHGKAIARFFIALIPRIERAAEELQSEFFDELILQAKNFGGECRQEFEKRAGEFALLKKAIDAAKRYYDGLGAVQNSSIGQMDVYGYREAARLYGRRFSTEVSKGAEAASVFMQVFKHVNLLYGKQWSSFQGGTLGQSSGLQTISSSMEIPRLEIIDPEGMALHRLEVSTFIARFTKGAEDEKPEA
jgi:hypothetical protein